jgi:hypothetical protein
VTDRIIDPPTSDRPDDETRTLRATVVVPLVYVAAAAWCVAAVYFHDSAWPIAAGLAMLFGFLANLWLPITGAARSSVDEPARVALSGVLIILGFPFYLVFLGVTGHRAAPLGLGFGVAAAAGLALGAAIACSVDLARLDR